MECALSCCLLTLLAGVASGSGVYRPVTEDGDRVQFGVSPSNGTSSFHNGTHHPHPGYGNNSTPAPVPTPTPRPPGSGARQSPININTCDSVRRQAGRIVLRNFDRYPVRFNVTNTGKDVMGFLTWEGRRRPTISGGRLPGAFVPFAIDFHWGTNSTVGSEHTVNGRRYALELHIQCRNVKYDSTAEALERVDGLAVIGIFYDTRTYRRGGRAFGALAEALYQIKKLDTTVEVKSPPNMREFLPVNTDDYVQYEGSLTSSPFSQVVSWTVMLTPVRIVDVELGLLRDLKKEGGKPIGNTFRDVQPRCGRTLYRTGIKNIEAC